GAGAAGARVRGGDRQPVGRGGTRLHRRRHQSCGDARTDRAGPSGAADETRATTGEEAWEHPAVSTSSTHPQIAALAEAVSAGLPGLKVVKGEPDEAELAALVASILSARAAQQSATDDRAGPSVGGDARRRWGVRAQTSP